MGIGHFWDSYPPLIPFLWVYSERESKTDLRTRIKKLGTSKSCLYWFIFKFFFGFLDFETFWLFDNLCVYFNELNYVTFFKASIPLNITYRDQQPQKR